MLRVQLNTSLTDTEPSSPGMLSYKMTMMGGKPLRRKSFLRGGCGVCGSEAVSQGASASHGVFRRPSRLENVSLQK